MAKQESYWCRISHREDNSHFVEWVHLITNASPESVLDWIYHHHREGDFQNNSHYTGYQTSDPTQNPHQKQFLDLVSRIERDLFNNTVTVYSLYHLKKLPVV